MAIKELKKLCLEIVNAEEEKRKLLLGYYKKNRGKSYSDFLKTKKGKESDNKLKLARENLNKVIVTECTEYNGECCLDVIGILRVINLLEKNWRIK